MSPLWPNHPLEPTAVSGYHALAVPCAALLRAGSARALEADADEAN